MRKTTLIGFAFSTTLLAVVSLGTATAGQKCDTSMNACAAFWKEMYQNEVRQKPERRQTTRSTTTVRETTRQQQPASGGSRGKSCVILRQKGTGALVATVGPYRKRNNAHVIASGSPQWKSLGNGVYQATWCIDKSLMVDVKHFTICGSVGHYYFNYNEARQFKRQSGPLGANDVARMWSGG